MKPCLPRSLCNKTKSSSSRLVLCVQMTSPLLLFSRAACCRNFFIKTPRSQSLSSRAFCSKGVNRLRSQIFPCISSYQPVATTRFLSITPRIPSTMSSHDLYGPDTPDDVKSAKGLHLITQSTPNGQKVQIMLEELALAYPGTEWSTTLINIMTNEQKKDWFLRLDPNGRIPVLVDNTQDPPFPVMETSAELLYLLKFADKKDIFGFTDELERNDALQWLFFWHGSGESFALCPSLVMLHVRTEQMRS